MSIYPEFPILNFSSRKTICLAPSGVKLVQWPPLGGKCGLKFVRSEWGNLNVSTTRSGLEVIPSRSSTDLCGYDGVERKSIFLAQAVAKVIIDAYGTGKLGGQLAIHMQVPPDQTALWRQLAR
jgi:hypothetical protein